MKYSAIILAAGSGFRTGLGFNKVLLEINDKKVIQYSLDIFLKDLKCAEILLVVPKTEYEYFSNTFKEVVDKIIVGGSIRQHSVQNALKEANYEYVIIHDGARPFIKSDAIDEICSLMPLNSSITLGVLVTDTIQQVKGKHVIKTLDRSNLILTQTPQAFRKDILIKAHILAEEADFVGTDDTVLVEKFCNIGALVVSGDKNNIKLTTLDDVKLLEVILK